MTAIGANSEHAEAAMRLYNAGVTEEELYNMPVFGLKGVHDTDLSDGYGETVWEDTIAFDEAAYPTSLFDFTFDPSPVRNEATACASIYVENRPTVIHADDFDAAMSDFVDALEDAGIQKAMDEAQRQINAWWASKERAALIGAMPSLAEADEATSPWIGETEKSVGSECASVARREVLCRQHAVDTRLAVSRSFHVVVRHGVVRVVP